jgi:hypothetical protein
VLAIFFRNIIKSRDFYPLATREVHLASLSPATTHANALSCALSAASGLKSKKDIDRLVVDRFKVDAVFESGK